MQGENAVWDEKQIAVVISEMEELLHHFRKGTPFFKYGKRQRMLTSAYLMTESIKNLAITSLGIEIIKLQEKYDRL